MAFALWMVGSIPPHGAAAELRGYIVFSSRDYVIDLEEGSQHLIRYKTIAPLVASGAVQLI